jgi:hypothetical protein
VGSGWRLRLAFFSSIENGEEREIVLRRAEQLVREGRHRGPRGRSRWQPQDHQGKRLQLRHEVVGAFSRTVGGKDRTGRCGREECTNRPGNWWREGREESEEHTMVYWEVKGLSTLLINCLHSSLKLGGHPD